MTITNFETIIIHHLATVCGGARPPTSATQPASSVPASGAGWCATPRYWPTPCSSGDVPCSMGHIFDGANQRLGEARQPVQDLLNGVNPMNATGQVAQEM